MHSFYFHVFARNLYYFFIRGLILEEGYVKKLAHGMNFFPTIVNTVRVSELLSRDFRLEWMFISILQIFRQRIALIVSFAGFLLSIV